MASRTNVNNDFAYYIQGDELAVLYVNPSNGKYISWSGSDVQDGLRITYTAKYEAVSYYENNLADDNKVDSGLHAALLDYVKSRLEEDMGNMDKSMYYHQKYRNKVRTYPHRKTGQRGIAVPNL